MIENRIHVDVDRSRGEIVTAGRRAALRRWRSWRDRWLRRIQWFWGLGHFDVDHGSDMDFVVHSGHPDEHVVAEAETEATPSVDVQLSCGRYLHVLVAAIGPDTQRRTRAGCELLHLARKPPPRDAAEI